MHERIDVLSVLGQAQATFDNIRFEKRDGDPEIDAYWSARVAEVIVASAAVAELIEAAQAVQEQFAPLIAIHGEHTCIPMRERLDAAIARVQEGV